MLKGRESVVLAATTSPVQVPPDMIFPSRLSFFAGGARLAAWIGIGQLFAGTLTAAGFRPEKLAAMDEAVAAAITAKQLPGGVLWVEQAGVSYHKAFGQRAVSPAPERATEDTIYDAASLTKVIATTTAIMQLVERGRLDLDLPAATYFPAFALNGKGAVTVRQLMTHTSGLRPDLDPLPAWSGVPAALALIAQEKLHNIPGSTFVYSDINFIVLGEIVRLVSGRPLDQYAAEEIFRPLKMTDTGFLPPSEKVSRIAPTEPAAGRMLRGIVHDPTARMMGGVAGHAGLFTTGADLARFCRMLLAGGQLDGVRILRQESVAAMTRVQTDGSDRRGLGWDLDSRYSAPRGRWFPAGLSFGHTGFTGTSVWLDPTSGTFVIFLANRVHPDGHGDATPVRRALANLAAEATGEDAGAVLNGIDVLVRDKFAPLRGLRVGLVTNPTGRDREGRSTIDLLQAAPGVTLVSLFSPEHGIRGTGDAGASVGDTRDERSKLPVYSLYGDQPNRPKGQSAADFDLAILQAREPKPSQLAGLDALVFDIQDIGARFYTYSTTLGLVLQAAARAHKRLFVLDRVNPISGTHVEGPVMTRPISFIGFHPVPVRFGLTLGEFARLVNAERGFGADLVVIPCEHWKRQSWFDQTGLPWTDPSPAIRSLAGATLYPGLCLLEGTSVSVGRGTFHPFEQIGAPYIDGVALASEMNRAALPGVRFEAVRFTPEAALFPAAASGLKHGGKECGGIRVFVTDRDRCSVVDVGLTIALTLARVYPENFQVAAMARLLGDDETIRALKAGETLGQIKARWAPALAKFAARSRGFLLYGPLVSD